MTRPLTPDEERKAMGHRLVPCVCPRCDGTGHQTNKTKAKVTCDGCEGQQWILLEDRPSLVTLVKGKV